MVLRSIFFVSALAFATQGLAEETRGETGNEPAARLTYCEQLGKTAGFETEDLEDFIKECEEKRSGNKPAEGE